MLSKMAHKPVKYFVVDAFTDSAFKGNPAAVCLVEEDRDEDWLQAVATEFNISETCYLTCITQSPKGSSNPLFRLRWFTPVAEVDLCGHATLAAAHILFSRGLVDSDIIEFDTRSGILTAKKVPDTKSKLKNGEAKEYYLIELNLPSVPAINFNADGISAIHKALNISSFVDTKITTTAQDIIVELPSAEAVTKAQPQFEDIVKCPGRGLIITGAAPSDSEFDFHSRFFCPKLGANEFVAGIGERKLCFGKLHHVARCTH